MSWLVAGLVVFLGIGSISIFARGVRDRAIERLGEGAWKGLYSLIATVGLGMIVWGYPAARAEAPVLLYVPPTGLRHLSLLLMAFASVLVCAAYLPGRIRTATRHPMLLSVKVWATAHLLANGMLHDVLLFGGFLAWAVLDRVSFRWRPQNVIQTAPPSPYNDLVAIGVGLGFYVVTLAGLHDWLVRVRPIPSFSWF